MSTIALQPDEFRDTLATVDSKGKRLWVFPKKPKGKMHDRRALVAAVLIISFLVGPFITIHGQPLVLINVLERRFIFLGQAFFPQDFYLFALGLIIFFVFIIVFTVAYGRLWCGWACPQTVFMEMVFRKIEYWIEGDANAQRKLASLPFTSPERLKKTVLKQGLFVIVALIIAHAVMAYIVGWRQVLDTVTHSPVKNLSSFFGIMAFTGVFYFAFAYLREQACIAICPYGRLQGVLLDKNSATVIYDTVRGEPRGKAKSTDRGACIDCHLCVQVCPTGIDIRNGTQLECVNCTACIDACDSIMDQVNQPRGLVRIDSLNGVEGKAGFGINKRIIAYTVVLTLLLGLEVTLFAMRKPIDTTVMRVPGMLFHKEANGGISNLYNVQLMNKTFDNKLITFKTDHPTATIRVVGNEVNLPAAAKAEVVLFIALDPNTLTSTSTTIPINVYSDGELLTTIKTKFTGPVKRKTK